MHMTVKDRIKAKKDFEANLIPRGHNLMAMLGVRHSRLRDEGKAIYGDNPGPFVWSNALDILHINPYQPEIQSFTKDGVTGHDGFYFRYRSPVGTNEFAHLMFHAFRPKKGADVEVFYSEPELIDSDEQHQRVSWRNESYETIPWTPNFGDREESEDTFSKQLGTTIAAGFRQLIGYGGDLYGAKGETEFTLNVTQSINLGEQKRKLFRTDIDSVTDIMVKEWTEAFLERTLKRGTMRQTITTVGDLEMSIRVESDKDFWIEWPTMEDAILCMQGVGVENGKNWADQFRAHPLVPVPFRKDIESDTWEIINQFFSPLKATIVTEIEIDGALDIKYRHYVKNLPIPDEDGEKSE